MRQTGSRICGNCGTANSAADEFCSNCGYSLASGPPDLTIQSMPGAPNVGVVTNRRITGALISGNLLGGRYRVVQLIGRGGFGAVYKATDERFQSRRVVAIKEMSDAQLKPAEKSKAIKDFRNEAGLLVELNHPNLPNVSDFLEEGDKAYLVMEFIEGKTLETIQTEVGGPLNELMVMGWALQLCAVLHYLHTRPHPIIFRDMKPANVMITTDGQIKLIDFGIARIFKAAMTKDTTLLGSQGYAPLEQYGRGQSDARSDIYALGATLYDLLTKELPLDAPTRRINPQAFMTPREINPTITPAVEAIVLKAMADMPEDRYQTIAEMYQTISAAGITPTSQPFSSGNTTPQMPTMPAFSLSPTTPPLLVNPLTTGPTVQISTNQGRVVAPSPNQPSIVPPIQPQPGATAGQRHLPRRAFLIGGGITVGALAIGGTALYLSSKKPTSTPKASGTLTINFTYSTEKHAWMQQAISDFNNGNALLGSKLIQINGDTQGSGDAMNAILSGSSKPIAWSPASFLEISQLNAGWQKQHQQDLTFSNGDLYPKQLVLSPLVFAVWKERAQLLTKKYGSIDWPSIYQAVLLPNWSAIGGDSSWGPVKLGQTSPLQSNSGLLSITLIAYSYYKLSRGLTATQIQDPGFISYFNAIEDAVQKFGRSSGTYLQNEIILNGPAAYDIILTYENLVLTNEQAAQSRQKQLLQPFYPGVNILSDHPFAILNGSWVSTEERQAAQMFRDFLLAEDQQRKALQSGFRPTNARVTINDKVPNNPFISQPAGVTVQPNISNQAQAPNGTIIEDLLTQWNNRYSSAPTALSIYSGGKGSKNNATNLA